jgi:hypothetical protein
MPSSEHRTEAHRRQLRRHWIGSVCVVPWCGRANLNRSFFDFVCVVSLVRPMEFERHSVRAGLIVRMELLKYAPHVEFRPFLNNPSLTDSGDVNEHKLRPCSCWWNALIFTRMICGHSHTACYLLSFCYLILNSRAYVRESLEKEHLIMHSTSQVHRFTAARRIVRVLSV